MLRYPLCGSFNPLVDGGGIAGKIYDCLMTVTEGQTRYPERGNLFRNEKIRTGRHGNIK